MKKIIKKVVASALAVGMVGAVAVTSAFAANVTSGVDEHNNIYISNDYLSIFAMPRSGQFRFYIDTKAGNPDLDTDDNKKLLYHGSSAYGTSKFFPEVDGECQVCQWSEPVASEELGSITATDNVGGIDFTKSLKFIPNKTNGREDAVEVRLTATNTSEESHQVGARIMLDTMLGSNDDAPFRVAGIGAVTTRTQLEGDSIPDSFQAFDSLEDPTVVSAGSFAAGIGKPDIVQFNNWSVSSDSNFIPECDATNEIGDSAVNAIWNPVTLAPGESRNYVVYYGVGEVQVNNEGELVLGATRDNSTFEVNEDGTGYNPVSITTYLKNIGEESINNAEVSIDLPEGVRLTNGENPVKYDILNINAEMQNTWVLNVEPTSVERTVTVTVNAKADDVADVVPIVYTFTVPAIEGAPAELPTEPKTEPETEPETDPATQAPTQAATQAATQTATQASTQAVTQAATQAPTQAAVNTTAANTTTNETGKVATGDSTAVLALLAGLLTVSGVVTVVARRRVNK